APAAAAAATSRTQLDQALDILASKAREFARTTPAAKAALLRQCIPRVVDIAPEWVATGCRHKGISPDAYAEEWLAGVMPTVRMMRLLAESLEAIWRQGKPPLGRSHVVRPDGRLEVQVLPSTGIETVFFAGFTGKILLQPGMDRGEACRRQASFYDKRDPEGGISLVLGAGNVSSIPPMDAFTKMFIEGFVCLVKMNPVNEWVGPILERALAPMIDRGYLRIVYGGGDVGKYLTEHPAIADIHITGSDLTHDLIVWGPPGPERERRKAAGEPLLSKPISSELGNVSPVAIVPHQYSDDELAFQAHNLVTMVVNNGSFNCNAAKMVMTSAKWPQRQAFLSLVAKTLERVPARKAYYPGALDRYRALTEGRNAEKLGKAPEGCLPWTLMRGIDPARDEKLLRTEPFCAILSETTLDAGDPVEFLAAATSFMNDKLWGTLNAMIVIHPKAEAQPAVKNALGRAIDELRYGTVAINHWPAVGYAAVTLPWGGHPSATLANIQSGLGWVHNTFMLEGIEKAVLRGPLVAKPKPVWFHNNAQAVALGPRLTAMEATPSWLRLPRIVVSAMRG
ncbi:MAG: aldehyde dehydrogenase, partial [Deltaproteobacteria bacterium]|nr:aldehyde dehydrogenase [Deltaproteobacteria bacterium]